MSNDYVKSFPAKVSDALAKMLAAHVKSVRKISLRAKDRILHQPRAVTLGRCLHDVGRLFEFALKKLLTEGRSFFHHSVVHRANCVFQMAEPYILPEEYGGCDGRPDQAVAADVLGITGAGVHHSNADVPAKQEHANDRFAEQAV